MRNYDLVNYLLGQLRQSKEDRLEALKQFSLDARIQDWSLSHAGQRVQIIKRTSRGGSLKMGTEVVTSSDRSLAALLGASPGASTSVSIMLEVLQRCWAKQMESTAWKERIKKLLPTFRTDPNSDHKLLMQMRERSDSLLGLN